MKLPANKEQKQMWLYIIVLAVMIGIIWLFFFQKQMAGILRQKQEAKKDQPGLGDIFDQFKQSIADGAAAFKQVKENLPELATSTSETSASTTSQNLNQATTTDNFRPEADQPTAEVK